MKTKLEVVRMVTNFHGDIFYYSTYNPLQHGCIESFMFHPKCRVREIFSDKLIVDPKII